MQEWFANSPFPTHAQWHTHGLLLGVNNRLLSRIFQQIGHAHIGSVLKPEPTFSFCFVKLVCSALISVLNTSDLF